MFLVERSGINLVFTGLLLPVNICLNFLSQFDFPIGEFMINHFSFLFIAIP